MFKKFVTSMMVAAMFTVQAHAATNGGLKAAFDEMNYAITVEGKNSQEEVSKFSAELQKLKAQGLTNEDLISFIKSEVKDQRVSKDLEAAFSMISLNNMTREDASRYMTEAMKKSYSAGASWNGEALMYIGLGVLIVAAAVSLAAAGYTGGGRTCGASSGVYICDTNCYSDYWYGYTCYDDCYYSCY